MGFITGLKQIDEAMNRTKGSGPKVEWLKLKDGESAKIRFANELDPDSAHYSEDRGLAIVVSEHTNPKDFRKKAVCTRDVDGRCFACEQAAAHPKTGWHSRLRYYTNVVVDKGLEKEVAVWSQGVSTKSAFNIIREYAIDTGSVTNLWWKIKRNGEGTDTSYVLMPLTPDTEPFDWSGIELVNLEKIVREIPYPEQEAYYLGFDANIGTDATSNMEW